MGKYFIEKDNKGFWISNLYLSVASRYIVECYDNSMKSKYFYNNIRDDFFLIAIGYASYFLIVMLEEKITNQTELRLFIELIEETKKYLVSTEGEYISKERFNSFPHLLTGEAHLEDHMEGGFYTKEIIIIYDELIKLVKGEYTNDASSNIIIPFI